MEKKELDELMKVIKNKKKVENQRKELNFSTAKNKSKIKKSHKKKNDSLFSIDIIKVKNSTKKVDKNPTSIFSSKLVKRSKRNMMKEENVYQFLKVEPQGSSM